MTPLVEISLERVKLYGFHGVEAQERRVGADYELTLHIRAHVIEACHSDDVADTVNYAEMYEVVKKEFSTPSNLLEHVACRIGESLLAKFSSIHTLDIKLTKIAPPIPGYLGNASVRLEMTRDTRDTSTNIIPN